MSTKLLSFPQRRESSDRKIPYSWIFHIFIGLCAIQTSNANTPVIDTSTKECVILLHGLARSANSMNKMEKQLTTHGFTVVNVDYPSTKHDIEYLSEYFIPPALEQCNENNSNKVHFVTHSMGGILVRHYLAHQLIEKLGNIVMLSPPNQGSEVVDKLKHVPGFYLLNGPAGNQLGTDANSIPLKLGPADYTLGIITGNKSINLFLSTLIPGKDDGKVAIERAKLEGMQDFLVLPHSHPFIMQSNKTIEQTIYFLKNGKFK